MTRLARLIAYRNRIRALTRLPRLIPDGNRDAGLAQTGRLETERDEPECLAILPPLIAYRHRFTGFTRWCPS